MSEPRLRPVRRALISVSDKAGLIPFAQALARHQVALVSTGGTAKALTDAGLAVEEVAAVTKFPELLDGRLKTLHPAIHGGILAKRDERAHMDAIAKHGIAPIDLVVVNLYPFAATVARGAPFDECVENIDIGGPSLIRAAAKNHADVVVATDAADYDAIVAEMDMHKGATTLALRRGLAQRAFARTAAYDAEIAWWLARQAGDEFPEALILAAARKQTLRYGENPHQHAAFYVGGAARKGVATAHQLQGKELSYNNLNDTDAAFELAAEFAEPAVVIVKHGNPCGVAVGDNLRAAWDKALATDPTSAFGGSVSANQLKTVTKRAPSRQEIADLIFAFRVCKHVKSNAIVFAKGGATVGVGAGQMSRVDSVRVAAQKGGAAIKGSVIASDAFFPFADGLEAAVAAGATAAIQPGGSVRDNEVITAADKAGIALVFTGMRHFRH